MKHFLLLLLLASCTRLVPVKETTTTKERVDTVSHAVTVNVPKSDVSVTINIDSLLGQSKVQDRIIYLKGESGRSSYDIGIQPSGRATVECHCQDTVLHYMQEMITRLVERDTRQVVKEEPSVWGKLVSDVQNYLFWILLAAAIAAVLLLRK